MVFEDLVFARQFAIKHTHIIGFHPSSNLRRGTLITPILQMVERSMGKTGQDHSKYLLTQRLELSDNKIYDPNTDCLRFQEVRERKKKKRLCSWDRLYEGTKTEVEGDFWNLSLSLDTKFEMSVK